MNLFPNKHVTDNIRKDPLYQKALSAFSSGDQQKGMELLNQLNESTQMDEIKNFYKTNEADRTEYFKKSGIIMIGRDDQIPDGYSKNTYSDKTCISSQPKDKPEWKNCVAEVLYQGKSVYEDHYMLEFTTMNMLYGIKKKNPESFIGNIITSIDVKNTLEKFKKNSLYLLIDRLNVKMDCTDQQCCCDLLKGLKNIKTLRDINIVCDAKHIHDQIITGQK
jgi:hypothetical protein